MRILTFRSTLRTRAFALIGCAAVVAGGCAVHRPPETTGVGRSAERVVCQLVPAPQRIADSLWIVATDRVVPGDAPNARTLAERVVFPLLYAIPIAPGCDRIVVGPVIGIAIAARDTTGQQWARQASPLQQVVGVTIAAPDTAVQQRARQDSPLQPLVVAAIGAGDTVGQARAGQDSPLQVGQGWRPTTGPYGIAAATDSVLDLVPRAPSMGPRIQFTTVDESKGRDAVDAGADIVLTSEPKTIAYAAAQSDLISVPLPWDRVYVLIEPARRNYGDRDTVLVVQRDLAFNALHVEARPATDSAQGMEVASCPTAGDAVGGESAPVPSLPGRTPTARIVYEKDDGVAQAISERLVALAQARPQQLTGLESALSSAGAARAAGLDRVAFQQALRDGTDAAYVVAVPFDAMRDCSVVHGLESIAPWLRSTGGDSMASHIAPLVETRARALVRRGRVGLAVDGAGNVYLLFGSRARS